MMSMRKVELRMNEQAKYETIKEYVDHGGNKERVAHKLGISPRQVNRLIKIYKDKGKAGFVHGNRNRQPVNTLHRELTDKIVDLYSRKYQGFNFKHFTEKLNEVENIKVSYKVVYQILSTAEINSPKIQKKTKRKRAKAKILKNNPTIKEEDLEIAVNHEVALEDAHPRQERAKYFGELVQMDASIHLWFGSEKSALHLAIDNASGNILGGYFDKQETLFGYYTVFKQILMNYGIIFKFLTDNRTVFNYEKQNRKNDAKDVLTQFGYACKILGVQLETSSVSQAKGQIERANGTFQDRLVSELRLEGITTIEEANDYLINIFIPDFNKRFAMDYKSFLSVIEEAPHEGRINQILSVLSPRTMDNGSSIKYMNKYYQAYDENNHLICFEPKTECLVINSYDHQLFITVDTKVYKLKELRKNKTLSNEFDDTKNKPKEKKLYIPPMSHPWKRSSFLLQQEKAHKYHQYT